MIKKVLVLATCMVFLLAGVAQADYFKFVSTSGTNINITDPGGTGATFVKLYDVDFGTPAARYNAFCVDWASVSGGGEYNNYYMINVPNVEAYNEAAYIFNKYASINGALAQIAIWEVVFEQLSAGTVQTVKEGTGQGKFYVNNSNTGGLDLTQADAWVADAFANGKNFDASSFRLLVSPGREGYYGNTYQDVLVRVPEPGVLTLLGLGLVALGITRRRSK